MKIEYHTKEQIIHLIGKFNNKILSKTEWTHYAHLTVAIWHIATFDFYEAICRLKSGIILLNCSHQTENTGSAGYHETMTIFWSQIVQTYIRLNDELSIEQLVNGFLNSKLADRNLPFQFYEKEELLTPHLRSIYKEPIKRKIDEFTIKEILMEK